MSRPPMTSVVWMRVFSASRPDASTLCQLFVPLLPLVARRNRTEHDLAEGRIVSKSSVKFFTARKHFQNHLLSFLARLRLLCRLQAIHDGIKVRFVQRQKKGLRLFVL